MLRSATTTLAPSLAKSLAVASPIPAPAPVISAILFFSFMTDAPLEVDIERWCCKSALAAPERPGLPWRHSGRQVIRCVGPGQRRAAPNVVRKLLRHHDDRCVEIAADDLRHDRSIDD